MLHQSVGGRCGRTHDRVSIKIPRASRAVFKPSEYCRVNDLTGSVSPVFTINFIAELVMHHWNKFIRTTLYQLASAGAGEIPACFVGLNVRNCECSDKANCDKRFHNSNFADSYSLFLATPRSPRHAAGSFCLARAGIIVPEVVPDTASG
jgi:hypothetical protein